MKLWERQPRIFFRAVLVLNHLFNLRRISCIIISEHLLVKTRSMSGKALSSISGSAKPRNYQERLRSDHIAMMEMLQQANDENGRLKAELSILKSLGSVSVVQSNDRNEDGDVMTSELIEKIDKQEQEIKLLRRSLSEAEYEAKQLKDRVGTARSYEDQLLSSKARQKELDLIKNMEAMELEIHTQRIQLKEHFSVHAENMELQSRLQQMAQQLADKEADNNSIKQMFDGVMAENRAVKEDIKQFEAKLTEKSNHDRSYLESVINQRTAEFESQINYFTNLNDKLRSDLAFQTEAAQQSRELLSAKECELTMLKSDIIQMEEQIKRQSAEMEESRRKAGKGTFCDSDSEDDGSTFKLTSAATAAAQAALTGNTPEESEAHLAAADASSEIDGSFRFQEFLRLKRENKELKLRLAEIFTQQQGQGQQQYLQQLRSGQQHCQQNLQQQHQQQYPQQPNQSSKVSGSQSRTLRHSFSGGADSGGSGASDLNLNSISTSSGSGKSSGGWTSSRQHSHLQSQQQSQQQSQPHQRRQRGAGGAPAAAASGSIPGISKPPLNPQVRRSLGSLPLR